MSPKEVQGLQALAMAHGGSLTINPETGLPEAGFLENILPAVAGFALDAFLPGAGEALGGMFGLEGAAASQVGSALAVGGISGLASGSLEKGIMAGMGAYGGAGLSQSLGNMGAGVNARAANASFDGTDPTLTDTERVAAIQAASKPDIGTGFSAAAKAPMDFLKDNKMNLALLAAPILMDSFGNKDSGPEANPSPGYIRTMKRDPVTGRIYQESAIPTGEFGGRSVGTYGGVPSRSMAEGGSVDENDQVAYDTRTDSQKSFDYLMGKPESTNPMLFKKSATGAIRPADMLTRTGGRYVLDAATNTYVWVPDAGAAGTAGTAGTAGLASLQERLMPGKGDRDPKEQARIDAFMDAEDDKDIAEGNPVGTTRGARIKDDLSFLSFLNPLNMVNSVVDVFQGKNPVTGGWNTGYNEGTLGTGVSTQSQDAATNAEVESQAQANAANTLGVNDAAVNAAANAAQAQANAIAEGNKGENQGGSYGVTDSGYGMTPDGGIDGSMFSKGGIAALAGGGLGSLGGYSDGGQLLKGPGDGVSDSIPARIGRKQPARLADGEFVVPARIVSELGNGSTEAGARQLYKMLDRIQAGRKKTVGKNKTAVNSKSARYLPA
jgi:hypothetical protein